MRTENERDQEKSTLIRCRIREIRKEKKIGAKELMANTGIAKVSLWRYETKERLPDLEVAYRIAKYLECSIDDLVEPIVDNNAITVNSKEDEDEIR